jgi:hypothetical protein
MESKSPRKLSRNFRPPDNLEIFRKIFKRGESRRLLSSASNIDHSGSSGPEALNALSSGSSSSLGTSIFSIMAVKRASFSCSFISL